MVRSRDLFDDTTMSFGEHLEVLRTHLWRALVGTLIAIIFCLFVGDRIFAILRSPIEAALSERGVTMANDAPKQSFIEYLKDMFRGDAPKASSEGLKAEDGDSDTAGAEDAYASSTEISGELMADQLRVRVSLRELRRHGLILKSEAGRTEASAATDPDDESVSLIMTAPEFVQLKQLIREMSQITTLTAEEGFMTYIKVCCIAGLVLASPWIFYQIWLFVAAGLHPHERKYIYVYLPMSLGLFIAGALAGFYYAFPLMLSFFISFNKWLNITMQPRLSEYITLVLILPLMFGISFQLPMAMLFLERIGIFTVNAYWGNWRMAVLVISVISMILTPADPGSMMLMFLPLVVLYFLGIALCRLRIGSPTAPIQ